MALSVAVGVHAAPHFGPLGEALSTDGLEPPLSSAPTRAAERRAFSPWDETNVAAPGRILREPTIVVDEGGVVHVMASGQHITEERGSCGFADLVHYRSDDGGHAWSAAAAVIDSTIASQVLYPQLSAAGGRLRVAYTVRDTDCADGRIGFVETDLRARRLSSPVHLSEAPGRYLWGQYPSVLSWEDEFVCLFQQERGGSSHSVDQTRSRDGGRTWSVPADVDSTIRGPSGPQISLIAGAKVPGTYSFSYTPDAYRLFIVRTRDFGETWESWQVAESAVRIDDPSLAYAPNGRLGLAFAMGNENPTLDMWFGWVPDTAGEPLQNVTRLNDPLLRKNYYFPILKIGGDGTLHIGMTRNSPGSFAVDVYYARAEDQDGARWSTPVPVNQTIGSVHILSRATFAMDVNDRGDAWLAWNNGGLFGTTIGIRTTSAPHRATDIAAYAVPRFETTPTTARSGRLGLLLDAGAWTSVAAYNARGARVATRARAWLPTGFHEIDVVGANGRPLGAGVYFWTVRLERESGAEEHIVRSVLLP
jgi:hypothetical protein